jgi:hypothetical protein
LQSDAVALTYARYSALNIDHPEAETKSLFPSTATYSYATPGITPAPKASSPIDWNQTIDGLPNMDATNRHGGQSVIVPALLSAVVKTPKLKVWFGNYQNEVSVSGADIEPLFLECGHHWMVGQSGSGGTDCTSTQTNAQYVSFFKFGENSPPYYISSRFLVQCLYSNNIRKYSDYQNTGWQTNRLGWNICGQYENGSNDNGVQQTTAIGGASFLNVHNWYRPVPGWGGLDKSGDPNLSTFREIACHQRVYAQIAKSLSPSYYDYVGSSKNDTKAMAYYNWTNWDKNSITTDVDRVNALLGNNAQYKSYPQILHGWDPKEIKLPVNVLAVDKDPDAALSPLANCGQLLRFFDGATLTP